MHAISIPCHGGANRIRVRIAFSLYVLCRQIELEIVLWQQFGMIPAKSNFGMSLLLLIAVML